MSLSEGQRLSFYEVIGPIGAGGMGEVYRARDTRLDREVALKVLPDALVEHPEALARFEREAKLLAKLNHPNIAMIHGVDEVDGIHFLTLELVEGESLQQRLARGALPVDEAIAIARQIAEGLEAAHEAGIVHRDLKPANVIVRSDGTTKVLDFGLARRNEPTAAATDGGEALTTGYQILGTPGYLSPEQARGEPAGRRADVWSFGCIVYECLTGKLAFGGASPGERLRSMLESNPDFTVLPPSTPPVVRVLLGRCLAKDKNQRLSGFGDIKLLLEGTAGTLFGSYGLASSMAAFPPLPQASPAPAARKVRLVYFFALAVVAALLAGAFLHSLMAPTAEQRERAALKEWALALPPGSKLGWKGTSVDLSRLGRGSPFLDVSPDGRLVAYCVDHGDRSNLHIHDVLQLASKSLPETEDARGPFFSPDGSTVGFFADSHIQTVAVDGGAPREICRVDSETFSACFVPDGKTIVYADNDGLWRVAHRPGATPEFLAGPQSEGGQVALFAPSVSPDGSHVIFTVSTGTHAHVELLMLDGLERRVVELDGTNARYVRAGVVAFLRAGRVHVLRLTSSSIEQGGETRHVRDGIYETPSPGGSVTSHVAMSRDGTLVYAPAAEARKESVAHWVDRNGKGVGEPIASAGGIWRHARLSPDGERFAFDLLDETGKKDVWLCNFEDKTPYPVTTDGMSLMSAWTPSGELTVRSTPLGGSRLRTFTKPGVAGTALVEFPGGGMLYADCWAPDGKTLFLTQRVPVENGGTALSMWTWRVGDEGGKRILPNSTTARFPQISPDGKWLAFVDEFDGVKEVFVRPYPALDRPIMISKGGGGEPLWSKRENGLHYRQKDGAMYFVPFDDQPRVDQTEYLFTNRYDVEPGGHQHYDVSEDGRFLMLEVKGTAPDRLYVVRGALDDAASR